MSRLTFSKISCYVFFNKQPINKATKTYITKN